VTVRLPNYFTFYRWRIPCSFNARETQSVDGAESHKSLEGFVESCTVPLLVSASFALEDPSVYSGDQPNMKPGIETQDSIFLATLTHYSKLKF
jgi:hypothetical protein